MVLPPFSAEGLLPPGEYTLTFAELLDSILVVGPGGNENWNVPWRIRLIDGLRVLVRHLVQADITEVFIDGSFVEAKDLPNDIDGYFVVDRQRWLSGELLRTLQAIDPIWKWDSVTREPFKGYPKPQLPMWHRYRVELFPHYGQMSGIQDGSGRMLTFAEAFRQSRLFTPKGIIKIGGLT
jgi:hypothetical protein